MLRAQKRVDTLLARQRHVHAEQDRRGRIDGHRGRDLAEGNALEELLHVRQAIDRHPDPSHLGLGQWMVGVVADLGRQSKAVESPVWPLSNSMRKRAFVSRALAKPAYWRMVQNRPRYMVGRIPRVKG